MKRNRLSLLFVLVGHVGFLAAATSTAQVASSVTPQLVTLSHRDGRQVVCELIDETESEITIERLVTGHQHEIKKRLLGNVVRRVSVQDAIDAIGFVEFATWQAYRTHRFETVPQTFAVLPFVHTSGKETAECRQVAEQLTRSLRRRGAKIVGATRIRELVNSDASHKLLQPSAAIEIARLVSAQLALAGTISDRQSTRTTQLRLVDSISGQTVFSLSHSIQTGGGVARIAASLNELAVVQGASTTVAISPDSRLIAAAAASGGVRIWEAENGSQKQMVDVGQNSVVAVTFSNSGDVVASAGSDGNLVVTDLATGRARIAIDAHSTPIRSVAFSSSDRLIATGGDGGSIKIWAAADGQLQAELNGHASPVRSLAFAPRRQLLASASNDRTIKLWEPNTGKVQASLEGHSGYVYHAAFSPTGRKLATASGDGTVRLWDLSNQTTVAVIDPRAGATNCVAFSADGRLLATCHANETVMVWNAVTQDQRVVLGGVDGAASQLAFSPNGQFLAAACGDGQVRVWKLRRFLE